jgi:predicted nucleic acid-binding Zn ribbon protein
VPSTSYPKGYKDTKTLDFYIENYLFTMFCLENYNHYVINFITKNLSRFLPSTTPPEEIKFPYNPLKYLTQEAREKNMYIVIDIYKQLFDFIILERGLIRHLDDLVQNSNNQTPAKNTLKDKEMSSNIPLGQKKGGRTSKIVSNFRKRQRKRMVVFYTLYMLILAHKVVTPFEVVKNNRKSDSSEIEYKAGKP